MEHVMVDIETLGTKRESAPLISIAAVKFDLNKGTVDLDDAFYRNIMIKDALEYGIVESGTLVWWNLGDRHSVFRSILLDKDAVTTKDALTELKEWLGTPARVPWAKGTDFDFAVIDRLVQQVGAESLFSHYWKRRDMRTFVDMMLNLGVKKLEIPRRTGSAHNALSDVIYQVDVMIAYNLAALELVKDRKGVLDA